jgi:hypothetical protein
VVAEASFEALFPAPAPTSGAREPVRDARVADILEAVAQVAALSPVAGRAQESQVLVRHLLGVYGLPAAQYLASLASGAPEVQASLARVRLLCAPLG